MVLEEKWFLSITVHFLDVEKRDGLKFSKKLNRKYKQLWILVNSIIKIILHVFNIYLSFVSNKIVKVE